MEEYRSSPMLMLIQVAPASTQALAWWQIATGVIGVPAALLGLLYTFRLSQKTRLESKKIQLEILEKQRGLGSGEGTLGSEPTSSELLGARLAAARSQDFLIRFIIFWLATQGWSFVNNILSPFLNAAIAATIQQLNRSGTDTQSWPVVMTLSALSGLLNLGYAVVFLSLGLPLLRDISASLGVRSRDILVGRTKSSAGTNVDGS